MPNDDAVGKGGGGGENVSKSDDVILVRSLMTTVTNRFVIYNIAMNVVLIWGCILICQFTGNLYHLCNPRSKLKYDESKLVEAFSCVCDMLCTNIIFSINTFATDSVIHSCVSCLKFCLFCMT